MRVKLAAGAKASRVHLLVSDRTPRVEETPGYVDVTVPAILEHEVVAIDLV